MKKVPIIPLGIIIGQAFVANAGGGDVGAKIARFVSYYTAFDAGSGVIDVNAAKIGYLPWLVYGGAKFAMKIVPQMNPNRYLAGTPLRI